VNRTRRRDLGWALVLALAPGVAAAQPLWDIAATVGLFAGQRPGSEGGGYHEDWFQAVQGGVVAGRYLSKHLKIEIEGSATGGGDQYRSRRIEVPDLGVPYWISSHATSSVRSVGTLLSWQFRDNEWVHPFVQAGVTAEAEHVVLYTPEQYFYGDPRGSPERLVAGSRTEESTTWRARPVVGGGAKLYFRERAFVRTDARLSVDRRRLNLAVRLGVGVDF
jgi:hypothetical protein